MENYNLLFLKNDNLPIGHDCPVGSARHIVYQGAKGASIWRDLKILFKQPIFRTECYLCICNRGQHCGAKHFQLFFYQSTGDRNVKFMCSNSILTMQRHRPLHIGSDLDP